MNAWTNDLGDLRVLSVALTRDGGVINRANKYSVFAATDVERTFARERKRLAKAAADAPRPLQAVPAATPVATPVAILHPRGRA